LYPTGSSNQLVLLKHIRLLETTHFKSPLQNYGIIYHLILEVHYFYHLLRRHLRRIFSEKQSLKYFNCLHDVYNFSLDIKASFYFFVIHFILISSHTADHWFLESNRWTFINFCLNLNFIRLKWQKNLNFTSEFITLRAIFFLSGILSRWF